jgi:hypothetical protein
MRNIGNICAAGILPIGSPWNTGLDVSDDEGMQAALMSSLTFLIQFNDIHGHISTLTNKFNKLIVYCIMFSIILL